MHMRRPGFGRGAFLFRQGGGVLPYFIASTPFTELS